MQKIRMFLVLAMLAAVPMLPAADIYVATTGDDLTGDGSLGNPWLTVSNGMAHAIAGDSVHVAAGTYLLATNIFVTNAITLRGENRTNTFILWQFPTVTNRGIYLNHAGATVEEFTVTGFGMTQNAPSGVGAGGGVYLAKGTLRACNIISNVGADRGGGVYQLAGLISNCVISFNTNINYGYAGGGGVHAQGQVWNCRIADNAATKGGGVLLLPGALLANSVVSNNVSYYDGGGIAASASVISNCTVVNNSIPVASKGGGIYCTTNTVVYGTAIRDNYTGQQGGGVYCAQPGTQVLSNCEISGNQAPNNYGGGIMLGSGGLLLTNCVISNNYARSFGGGIEASQYAHRGLTAVNCRIVGNILSNGCGAGVALWSNSVLENCVVRDNIITNLTTAIKFGAGIFCRGGGNSVILNCLIAGNLGDDAKYITRGGGIYIAAGATNQIDACTIVDNYARAGGGIYLDVAGDDSFTNCIVVSNRVSDSYPDIYLNAAVRSNAFAYSCNAALTNAALGNITNAPIFADYSGGDYGLNHASPGVNAGTNQPWMAGALDLGGRTRIDRYSRRADMGCYEYLPQGALFGFR